MVDPSVCARNVIVINYYYGVLSVDKSHGDDDERRVFQNDAIGTCFVKNNHNMFFALKNKTNDGKHRVVFTLL